VKSATQLQKEIEALQAKVGAIQAIAKEDNRDLSTEEQAEIDSIVGDDKNQGQITALATQRERAIRIESAVSNSVRQVRETQADEAVSGSFRIPATARATGTLKAFKGPNGAEDAFRSGQFIRALNGNGQARQWCVDYGVMAAMNGSDDLRGGVLVPPEFSSAIIALMESYGVISRYARNYPMSSDTVTIPRRVSGLTAYGFTDGQEVAGITSSEPAMGQISLTAKVWATLTRMANSLAEDATISIAEYLAMEMAQAHALKLDTAGFLGNGEATNQGVVGLANALQAGSITQAAAGQNTDATLTVAVFQSAAGLLPEFAGMNPVWFCHKRFFWNVMARLQLALGGNNYVDLGAGPVLQFLGYPVQFTQVLPSTTSASAKVCYLGDLSMGTTLGLRRQMSVIADTSRFVEFLQTAFISHMRWDYNVHETGTPSLPGPIVCVQAAA